MENQQIEEQKIPTTLSEAHAELERILSPEVLAEIDAMPSEDDMARYHMGLGAAIRRDWGLWRGSPLAKHMQELGFTHPDDMSCAILGTFWCKRHGQDFHLKERTPAYWKSRAAQKVQEEEESRVRKAKTRIWSVTLMTALSVITLIAGFVCWILPRISLYKRGIQPTFGPGPMSRGYATLYKIGYLLMGIAVLLLLLFLRAY